MWDNRCFLLSLVKLWYQGKCLDLFLVKLETCTAAHYPGHLLFLLLWWPRSTTGTSPTSTKQRSVVALRYFLENSRNLTCLNFLQDVRDDNHNSKPKLHEANLYSKDSSIAALEAFHREYLPSPLPSKNQISPSSHPSPLAPLPPGSPRFSPGSIDSFQQNSSFEEQFKEVRHGTVLKHCY